MTPTLAELLASAELPDSDSARLDAELLLCHAIGKPRSYLRTWPERRPDAEQLRCFEHLLSQRRSGVPVAYLLGEQGFWSLQLEVSEATLIPRPDTERLVEVALELGPAGPAEVLDLGTGTGAIALALAVERPQWRLTGVDRIIKAVALAAHNAARLQIGNAHFEQSDWFGALADRRFNLIVSNPPYIAESDPHLQQGDVRFEPGSALVSGVDGLDDIRKLVQQAPSHLHPDGWLLFEHGWQQAEAVVLLLREQGFERVQSWRDLGGQQRVTGGQWHG